MHKAVLLWLLWFDSSLVVYRFGVPLFRLKLCLSNNIWISWHMRRKKADRRRWLSDMWARKANLIDSYFQKLGALSMRRHLSTSNTAPTLSYVYPDELTSLQRTIGIHRLNAFASTLSEVLPISENSQHYTLFPEISTCLCSLLTAWKRNQPQPRRWNHEVNTNKTQSQW